MLAARVMGLPGWLIMIRHILPNILAPLTVLATIGLALAIISEATLSFLGQGVPPTTPSLGTLIRVGNEYLYSGLWWITFFPAIALVVLVFAVNMLGTGCAMRSIQNSHELAGPQRPDHRVSHPPGHGQCRAGHLNVRGAGGNPRRCRRKRGRQVDHRQCSDGPVAGTRDGSQAGRIDFEGTDLRGLSPEEMRKMRGAKIGMIFQDPPNLAEPADNRGQTTGGKHTQCAGSW